MVEIITKTYYEKRIGGIDYRVFFDTTENSFCIGKFDDTLMTNPLRYKEVKSIEEGKKELKRWMNENGTDKRVSKKKKVAKRKHK